MIGRFSITPRGPFSLAAAASFGFGQREATTGDAMRLAFVLDGFAGQAGVILEQTADGVVRGRWQGDGDPDAVRSQTARILSLDHDGDAWLEVGRRDPVIGSLQAGHPGQRPVLFHSPYEAAAWCVIAARRPHRESTVVRRRITEQLGRRYELDGQSLDAFPTPRQLLALDVAVGLTEEKVVRLHGVARAALDGRLDPETLGALGPEAAMASLRELRGIGPFYAALIAIRATGFTDVLPEGEPRVLAYAGKHYGDGSPLSPARLAAVAEPWRPFRTWAVVLIRLAGDRGAPFGGDALASAAERPEA